MGIGNFNNQQGSNTFVGINQQGMENLKGDLIQLEKNVEGTLEGMLTDVSMDNAFKGEQLQGAVKSFVKAVKEEGQEWASRITEYCAQIDRMLSSMKTAQSQMASGLDTSSRAVSSQTERYTYGGGSSSAS